ncbi:hypothetical protein [Planctomicrobium sp. SH527]|uniref:hypothetical protein n=1 Tax=Planctomicrobium sp. SH527 TaxID=3448123 RepID=UPI003F5C6724
METSKHHSPYSFRERLLRVAWGFCQSTLFRWSPRPLWNVRNWLLKRFGADIGQHVHIDNKVRIFAPWLLKIGDHSALGDGAIIYNLGPLEIGDHVTVSQRAHLCGGTHDYRSRQMTLIRTPIRIEDDVWICAEAFIGPNVTIHEAAIVGARSVVSRDVEARTIVCGNPAKFIKERSLIDGSNRPEPCVKSTH